LIVLPRHWRSTTLRRTLPPTSRRSLTKNSTQPGIALLAETLDPMSHMKPGISSTSTWVKWLFYCSRAVKHHHQYPSTFFSHHNVSPCTQQLSTYTLISTVHRSNLAGKLRVVFDFKLRIFNQCVHFNASAKINLNNPPYVMYV